MRITSVLLVVALGAVAGCSSTSEPATDTGTPDTGRSDGGDRDMGTPHCRTDADCSDGTFCNGAERCLGDGGGDARGCAPPAATTPCMAGETCDEANDRCVTTCTAHDADGDGHESIPCGGDDCDDTDPHRYPGNTEVCAYDPATMMRVDPTHDEDCNPMSYANGAAGDGDQDMDGFVDSACANTDAAGHTYRGLDCADTAAVMAMAPFTALVPAASIHPTESEICNGVDDDCNGLVDDGLMAGLYYPDCDGDNFGDASATGVLGCRGSLAPCNGHAAVLDHTDCNDMQNPIHPGATEECDGVDNNCMGGADEAALADATCASHFPSTPHGAVVCDTAAATHACTLRCTAPYVNCNGRLDDGCEADTTSDAANCGGCGMACAATASCSASACEHITRIDAGVNHTCALYGTSGHLVCWGRNDQGQLGDGSTVDRLVATPVAPTAGGMTLSFNYFEAGGKRFERADSVVTDTAYTCGGTASGLYCWGQGDSGQLGYSITSAFAAAPHQVAILPSPYAGSLGTSTGTPTLTAVHVGGDFTIALQSEPFRTTAGATRTGYGEWTFGAAGNFRGGSPMSSVPVLDTFVVATAPPYRSYAAGDRSACVILANGQLSCTGMMSLSTLPTGWTEAAEVDTYGLDCPVPNPIDKGMESACIRGAGTNAGRVYCYGGLSGELPGAVGTIPGLSDATQICVGGRSACALRSGGTIQCWGNTVRGALGGGGGPPPLPGDNWSITPYTVVGITNATQVTCGASHACALLADHTVWCWGDGILGNGTMTGGATPVRVSGI